MRPLCTWIKYFFSPVNLSCVSLIIRPAKRTQEGQGGNCPLCDRDLGGLVHIGVSVDLSPGSTGLFKMRHILGEGSLLQAFWQWSLYVFPVHEKESSSLVLFPRTPTNFHSVTRSPRLWLKRERFELGWRVKELPSSHCLFRIPYGHHSRSVPRVLSLFNCYREIESILDWNAT